MRISDWSSDVCSSDLEHDHAIEIFTGPGENLVEARCVASARTQRRIGHEEDSVAHRDGGAQLPGRQRLDVDREAAKRSPVAPGIFEQRLVLRNPDMAAFPAHPAVENDARNLTRSEEQKSELQSLMRISYAGYRLKNK